ncbi:unnamed protein product, partial [Vitis vinifera]
MGLFKSLSISSLLLITLFFTSAHAAIFNIQNRCSYTVWAAAVPGGAYGAPPNTLAEFALNHPTSNGCSHYSRYFKTRCPDAYSYPKDDQTSTFTCPGGTNYDVIFCP